MMDASFHGTYVSLIGRPGIPAAARGAAVIRDRRRSWFSRSGFARGTCGYDKAHGVFEGHIERFNPFARQDEGEAADLVAEGHVHGDIAFTSESRRQTVEPFTGLRPALLFSSFGRRPLG